jgi:hypothetical protein
MKKPTSFLRILKLRSRIHSKLSKISDAVPKRIALKLKGEKSANAPFTMEKFMPQMKLIVTSNKSTAENLDFAAGAGMASVITFHSKGQFSKRQDCKH